MPLVSDSAIVAGKPTNKAGQAAAEPVERRAEAKGNASQQSTRRAQDRVSVSQALERIRQAARERKKERFTLLFHHFQHRTTPAGILLAQARSGTGRGWADLARL
jgi:RNA-directed DNA polymerase